MFLTGNHPNPLTSQFASDATGAAITWPLWALAASLPGIVSLICIPLLLWIAQVTTPRLV
jgi:DASS family divalent anion:Na+ symporter